MKKSVDIQELFYEYRDKCYGFFVKTLSDPELAKDLTQDIFLKVMDNQEAMSKVENWNQYFYSMCRNLTFDHLRKAGTDQKYKEYLYRYWNQSANHMQPSAIEKRIDKEYYSKVLENSLKTLPDQQRIIFNLSKKEGLSHQKIAQKLGISPITVRNHLHRAMQNIRASTHPDIELVLLIVCSIILF